VTRLLAVSFSLAACSSRAPAPTAPTGPDRGSAEVQTSSGSGSGSAAVPPVDTKVTEAECHAMIDHLIEVDIKERPADQQLAADQKAEVAAQLRAQYLPACLQQPRATVACITAAPSSAAINACE
jgi:hypothetical protein